MISVANSTQYNSTIVDTMVKAIISVATGVSTGPYGTIIHVLDGGQVQPANEVFAGIGALAVTTDKSTIVANGSDTATVNCNAPSISGDATVGYVVTLDGNPYSTGTTPVSAGAVQLTLNTVVAGRYDIHLYRLNPTYQSGTVVVTAS